MPKLALPEVSNNVYFASFLSKGLPGFLITCNEAYSKHLLPLLIKYDCNSDRQSDSFFNDNGHGYVLFKTYINFSPLQMQKLLRTS